ncbi:MAG: hypothetical protein DWB99_07350 [Candidatus Poseidoniales archaeon]|nr:MAG: hypothetical protein DWB99_07350 [Candidatus Poseidoniales archaeon]|tara:strand:- start:255 stop:809 length:555 start_codon:yes stop_codon:yes gene_type:complete
MGDKGSGLLGDVPRPDDPPYIPKGAIIDSLAALSGVTDAVFMPWIEDRIQLIWLESNDDRLGMTRFEEGPGELNRRRVLRLDPGMVTIGLHPALLEDEILYKHTFVHEFLHASGLTLHSPMHDELTNSVAPMPKLKDSPLLQRMRDSVLGELKVQHWVCKNCGYSWDRTTVRKPSRCHKCARPL